MPLQGLDSGPLCWEGYFCATSVPVWQTWRIISLHYCYLEFTILIKKTLDGINIQMMNRTLCDLGHEPTNWSSKEKIRCDWWPNLLQDILAKLPNKREMLPSLIVKCLKVTAKTNLPAWWQKYIWRRQRWQSNVTLWFLLGWTCPSETFSTCQRGQVEFRELPYWCPPRPYHQGAILSWKHTYNDSWQLPVTGFNLP